jgi:hypothetical protein
MNLRLPRITVGKVENLERQVRELTADERKAFREWFVYFEAEEWDRQFEADVKAGKLDALADRALRDHTAGRSAKL